MAAAKSGLHLTHLPAAMAAAKLDIFLKTTYVL
jgi:hypothetical protein